MRTRTKPGACIKPRLLVATFTFVLASMIAHSARAGGPCEACDADCNTIVNLDDVPPFVDILLGNAEPCDLCTGDTDDSGQFDGHDVAAFIDCLLAPEPLGVCCSMTGDCVLTVAGACFDSWLGPYTSCSGAPCVAGLMTAYRPQHNGGGYFPFAKTAVAEADKLSHQFGPGIRINGINDEDPNGEDDLIELHVAANAPNAMIAIRRTHPAIRLWLTAAAMPGTEIPFIDDKTDPLPFMPGASQITLWVEWVEVPHGTGDLILEPWTTTLELDRIRFHTFQSAIFALGGENQPPSVPVDSNHGTFVVGNALYPLGYDVYLFDEDNVTSNGSGPVYDEAVNAVRNRYVDEIAIFGYSHGGGSTYDFAERLDINRAGIGVFEITFTSYADGVGNNSDIDVSQETRRPPSTGYHANHYQNGSFADFFLDGGPVPNSFPGTTGLNVETTPWGAGSDHFLIDDYVEVRSFIEDNLIQRIIR